jgi:hypothetical protein
MPNQGWTGAGGSNTSVNGAYFECFIMSADGVMADLNINVGVDGGAGNTGRYAVYIGTTSSSTTDPTGATLLEDFGLIPDGVNWQQTAASVTTTIPVNTRVWIAFKSNEGAAWRVRRELSTQGDWSSSARTHSGVSADETAAFPATVPAGTATNTGAWFSAYLHHEAPAGGGGFEAAWARNSNVVIQ